MDPWHYRDADTAFVGELYPPTAPANGCAVLVAHEIDGIGGNVRRRCEALAALGYLAAAADLHGGGRVLGPGEIPAALELYRREPERLRRRIGTALDALAGHAALPASRLAAIGYCFGGTAVLELARNGGACALVASFHGVLRTGRPAAAGGIVPRVLACTGAVDPLVPLDDVTAFQQEMAAAEADWQLVVHGRARHSFTNVDVDRLDDPRMAYDAAADRLSWSSFLTMLGDTFG